MDTDTQILAIRQEIKHIDEKLDTMSRQFVIRTDLDRTLGLMEKRLDTIEEDHKQSLQWANTQHSSLAAAVAESERRIVEQINAQSQSMWSNRQALLVILITTIVGVAESIISIAIHH